MSIAILTFISLQKTFPHYMHYWDPNKKDTTSEKGVLVDKNQRPYTAQHLNLSLSLHRGKVGFLQTPYFLVRLL